MIFENRLVLSAMAGINDAEFCRKFDAALVILGGFNADRAAMEAAKEVMRRGRKEFLFSDPIEGIEEEIRKVKRTFAVNVRAASPEAFTRVAEIVDEYDGILEINAHCRQPEFVSRGCGEFLLINHQRLFEIVESVARIVTTSVKIRGSHSIDYESLCKKLFQKGCDIIHVDAMIPNGGCDYDLIKRISKLGFTIGNNSFTDVESGERIIMSGAKMASAARAVLKNPDFFSEMLKSPLLSQRVELSLRAGLTRSP